MCAELESPWTEHYANFYRLASVTAHAGSFMMGRTLVKLMTGKPISDYQKAMMLYTALALHLHVANLAAHVFPAQLDASVLQALDAECYQLGASVAIAAKSG